MLTQPLKSPAILLGFVVALAGTLVALFIGLGILLVVFNATGNTISSHIAQWANDLAQPFNGIFSERTFKSEVAANWGLAAGVYLVGSHLVRRLLQLL